MTIPRAERDPGEELTPVSPSGELPPRPESDAPRRSQSYLTTQSDLCWLAFLAALMGFLIGRWIP